MVEGVEALIERWKDHPHETGLFTDGELEQLAQYFHTHQYEHGVFQAELEQARWQNAPEGADRLVQWTQQARQGLQEVQSGKPAPAGMEEYYNGYLSCRNSSTGGKIS